MPTRQPTAPGPLPGPPLARLPLPRRSLSAEQIGLHAFRTRVFLPNNSPVPWADGVCQGGRKPAIAAAALQACRQLHQARGEDGEVLQGGPLLHALADHSSNRALHSLTPGPFRPLSYPALLLPLQLGALNDFLLPAVLDEPKRALPRAPKTPKQRPAAGRKRLAEPGGWEACGEGARTNVCLVESGGSLPPSPACLAAHPIRLPPETPAGSPLLIPPPPLAPLSSPDELLKNKAHEPLPPVVIEESRMLKGERASSLPGLLARFSIRMG